MLAKRKGEVRQWRVVVLLEALKAICRLILLRVTNSRPLVHPPMPQREADPRKPEEDTSSSGQWDGMETPPASEPEEELTWAMPRTGLSLSKLPESGDVMDHLLDKMLTADDVKAPRQLLHRMTTSASKIAEVAWILRPLIYALILQRYQKKKNSWTPWLSGMLLELAAKQLARRDVDRRVAGGFRGLSGLEREELGKRGWAMGWWAFRGAFYDTYTKYVAIDMDCLPMPWHTSLTAAGTGCTRSPAP